MCQKVECPHKGEVMCSCEAIKSGTWEEVALHLSENLCNFAVELSYETLETPYPYWLCVSGICNLCGERLCMCLEAPGEFAGNDLLAAVWHHLERLHPDAPGQFAALFHEEDRTAVQRWLMENGVMEKEGQA